MVFMHAWHVRRWLDGSIRMSAHVIRQHNAEVDSRIFGVSFFQFKVDIFYDELLFEFMFYVCLSQFAVNWLATVTYAIPNGRNWKSSVPTQPPQPPLPIDCLHFSFADIPRHFFCAVVGGNYSIQI